jgi:predicted transcriptional regulator of viral defense system
MLFDIASEWRGYFTTSDARQAGFSRFLLRHYANSGRFIRVHRGIYRFRDYPTMPRDEVVEAVVVVGRENAVVSHESALDLLDLSDIVPNSIHITIPRSRRFIGPPQGVTLHTISRPLTGADVTQRDGITITSATLSILDSLERGSALEQIEQAIREAIARGLTTCDELTEASRSRNSYTRDFVQVVVEQIST